MFRDRLISEEHVQQFEAILKQTMRKYYGKEVSLLSDLLNESLLMNYALQESIFRAEISKVQGSTALPNP